MKRKLNEGQIEDGVGWYLRRGKKLWRFSIYVHLPGSSKLSKRKGSGYDSQSSAERAAMRLRMAVEGGHLGIAPISARPTLAELIEKRLPTIARPYERARARRVLSTLLTLLPAGFQVQAVETEHLRRFVEKRQADGVAASSINRELNTVAATLNQAGEFFSSLKQWKTPKIPRPKVRQSRRERVISEDEYQRLLQVLTREPDARDGDRQHNRERACAARLRVAHIFQFAMLSAARHAEILGLEWKSVDWGNGRVLILQSKTDRYKQIPITAPMREILEYYKAHPISPRFVFSRTGKPFNKFYRILRTACELAEVPYGKNNPDGIVLHTARHTVTTRLIQAGNDLDTVGLITGHSAKQLIQHYSHHSPASLARAASALEGIGKSERKP